MGAIIFAREENRNVGCGDGFDGFQQVAREGHSMYRVYFLFVDEGPLEVPVIVGTSG